MVDPDGMQYANDDLIYAFEQDLPTEFGDHSEPTPTVTATTSVNTPDSAVNSVQPQISQGSE